MRTVITPITNLVKMTEILKWYDAMPHELHLGESYHEQINEALHSLRPEVAELDTGMFFVDGYELIDGVVRINIDIADEDDPENTDYITLIPSDE